MAELTVPLMNFSALGQLGNVYRKAQEDEMRKQTLASLGQGGEVDAQTLLKSGDLSLAQLGVQLQNRQVEDAWRRQESARAQGNSDRSYNLQASAAARAADPTPENWQKRADGQLEPIPGGPADPVYIQRVADIKKPNNVLQAGDKKIITAAEDELPNLDGTIDVLKQAKDLNDKTFTGYTAGARGMLGTSGIPGTGLLVDKNAAMATREWGQLMSGEAIKTMSDQLKGATTDFELKKFESMMADPSVPPEIRGRMIDRMLKLAEKHRETKVRRIEDLRGGTYFKPGGGSTGPTGPSRQIAQEPTAQPAPQNAEGFRAPPRVGELRDGYRFKGGNPGDPASWVKQQNFDDRFSAAYSGGR